MYILIGRSRYPWSVGGREASLDHLQEFVARDALAPYAAKRCGYRPHPVPDIFVAIANEFIST